MSPSTKDTVPELIRQIRRSTLWQAELEAFGSKVPTVDESCVDTVPQGSGEPEDTSQADAIVLSLSEIREEIGDCQRCKLAGGRQNIVFGVGNESAELMFIGEAPGAEEDHQGVPFVGRAGQLLTRMIGAMGLTRDDVYIANIIKCRPPGNRDPEMDEVVNCEPFLQKQIEAIQPKVIVSLGRVSAQTLLRVNTPISRLRGRWMTYHKTPLMPTFHPAYLLRNPGAKRDVWNDLQNVMAKLGLAARSR